MKNVLILIMLLLSSCQPKCPPGQKYECGHGCIALAKPIVPIPAEVTPQPTTEPVKAEVDHELINKSKFSITTKVCVLGKWAGTITDFWWAGTAKADPHAIIVYQVEYLIDEEFKLGEFYDTQLERGECR